MAPRNVDPVLISRLEKPPAPPARTPSIAPRPWVRRLAIALVSTAVVGVLLCQFALMALRPIKGIYVTGLESQRLEKQMAQLRVRRDALRERIRYLNTPQGIEEEARRQGWVARGEVALQVIRPEPPAGAEEISPPEPASGTDEPPPPRTFRERARRFFVTCWHAVTGGRGQ